MNWEQARFDMEKGKLRYQIVKDNYGRFKVASPYRLKKIEYITSKGKEYGGWNLEVKNKETGKYVECGFNTGFIDNEWFESIVAANMKIIRVL